MAEINWNNRQYPLVSLDQITLDEAILVYQYSNLTLDQIPDVDGFHPGFIAALIHISVARAEPNTRSEEIRKAVGKTPVADLEQIFAGISEEVDEQSVPPQSVTSSDGSSTDSGGSSTPTGEPAPASNPANGSGSPGSATGAIYDPATWAG